MKSRLMNLDKITLALKPYLEQYLQEHGIDTSKNFRCLNPDHNDGDPSMTCKQYPENAFCYGCGCTIDIFTAAHYLEGKPIKGYDFVENNVTYLANKFGVQIELQDLTPEEIYEYKTYNAYNMASKLISDPKFGNYSIVDKEINRRKWDKDKCAEWGIGTVSYKEYRSRMNAAGYDSSFLAGVDLDRSNLFNNTNLLFTVYDPFGRPVGFSAKNLKYNKEDKVSGPKYINTRGTGLECAIFKKGHRLYGFDKARSIGGQLYIFEGQADVITARHHGIMNCCCTLGTAITDHHINVLKAHGCFNIILVFDSDKAGELAVRKAVDEKFANEKDFRIKLCQLPEGMDPDELLRNNGVDEFARLKKWSAFEWRMRQFLNDDTDIEDNEERRREVAEKMTRIIVLETSHIRQEEMAKQVSKTTGYDLSTIISEVKRLRDEKSAEIQTRKTAVIEALLYEARKNPDEAETALVEAQYAIDNINKTVQDKNSGSSQLDFILSQKEVDEAKTGEFAGFFMKPHGLGGIAAKLDDDWKKDNLVFIGGSEQSSKTTHCAQMAYEIADDPRNNAVCIYHSIDDAKRYILYKWICNATEDLKLKLNHASNPNYWKTQEGHEFVGELREAGYRKITKLIKDERLVVEDSGDGQSIYHSESLIKRYKDKYPDRNIVLFLDNFHKLPDFQDMQPHNRAKRLCNMLKNMSTQQHVTIVSTVEYRKLGKDEMPSNVALAECLEENTIIRDVESGKQIKIKNVEPGMLVSTINENTYKIVNRRVLNKFNKGIQNCFNLKLKNGLSITATENHPVFTERDGWQKIKNVKINTFIATPRSTSITEKSHSSTINKRKARFLGYMAGDGNYGSIYNKSSSPRFTNSDKEIIKDITDIIKTEFQETKVSSYDHIGSKELRFSRTNTKKTNEVKTWLKEDIKIWGQTSIYKKVPELIFSCSKIIKANYIAGIFSTDGSVCNKKRQVRLFNTSKNLIKSTQTLLLDLGILSTINKTVTNNKKHKDTYTLRICSSSIELFKNIIPIVGRKKQKIEKMNLTFISSTDAQDNLPLIFSEKYNEYLLKYKFPVRINVSDNYTGHIFSRKKRITRKAFIKNKDQMIISPELKKYTEPDIIWQKVISIEPVGKKQVYDLEIDDTHNFLANNIFCHNSRSLMYDATVIIHLYNDMHYKGEDSVLTHEGADGILRPRILVKFGKNKVSGYEGRQFVDLYGENGQVRAVDLEQAKQDQKERMDFLAQNNTSPY